MRIIQAILPFFLCFNVLVVSSFVIQEVSDKDKAKVEQIDGLYIFYKSKPVNQFETLGSIKPGVTMTPKPSEVLDALVKRAKKNYPSGEALLIGDEDMNRADVIKFK